VQSIGLMDDRFFLYYEDLDWGVRAKKNIRRPPEV
jgi:GT2 family glycosyltransferase